mmetsp:Transcript_29662/g.26252  ORF Transcript_29662/g.26252 Transcript_29662/m.26252 type:complete len:83 (-) Transcript_29662:58-306(-)
MADHRSGGYIGLTIISLFAYFYYIRGSEENSCFVSSTSDVPVVSPGEADTNVAEYFNFAANFFMITFTIDTLRGFLIGFNCC